MEDSDGRDGSGYNFDEIKTGMAMEIDPCWAASSDLKIEDKLWGRWSCRINLTEIKKLQPACSSVALNCVLIYKKGLTPYRNQTLMLTIKL